MNLTKFLCISSILFNSYKLISASFLLLLLVALSFSFLYDNNYVFFTLINQTIAKFGLTWATKHYKSDDILQNRYK